MTGLKPVQGLAALEAQVRRDIDLTAHPRMDWMKPRLREGKPVLDVLIVGGGQSGMAIAFALQRERVRNVLVIDRAPEGKEGPWTTYARMPTLRSPKDQTGPDQGIPSLTFQAWYEAQYGAQGFADLHLIPTADWHAYLQWYRRVLDLPIRNNLEATAIAPGKLDDGGPCLLVTVSSGEMLAARKLVLATGQEGTGEWWLPDFIAALPADRRACTSDEIDFKKLRGCTVAVLGAGSSAMDNAATALEHGAVVQLFCRRKEPSSVQQYRWLTFAGFLRHLGDLPDLWRWRIMGHIMRAREGFPADTYKRVLAFPDFKIHLDRNWTDARVEDGRIRVETTRGPFVADFVICCLGIRQDLRIRRELASFADQIALWRDRFTPPPGEEDPWLANHPYLGPDYAFLERTAGAAPWLADIHLFGIGTTLSFGPSGSSVNAMTIAVPKLVAGLTRGLFAGDLERHWESLKAYDVKQVEFDWSRMERG